jgi:hypothetical protein
LWFPEGNTMKKMSETELEHFRLHGNSYLL